MTPPVPAAPVATVPAPAGPEPVPAATRSRTSFRVGWPAQWPTVRAWLTSGMLRNWRGTGAGIIGAWFNLPFVVMMGAVGALFGGLTGAVSGTIAGPGVTSRLDALLTWVFPLPLKVGDLLPTAALQIGGIIGGLLGAVTGAGRLAWAAFAWPWQLLYDGDPMWPFAVALGQIVTALFVGCLYTLWSVAAEGWRLKVAGARRLSRREAEFLMPIVEEVAGRLGLRGRPRVLLNDSREVNAFAGARHIVICRGLLDEIKHDREAVAGVIAHELVHWRDGDAVALAWSKGVALPLYLLYELAVRMLRVAQVRPIQFLVRFLLWSVLVTTRGFVIPLQAATWRAAEFRADQGAAAAGYGEGLRRVLGRLQRSFDGSRNGWDSAICATHPPTELRLERLERSGQSYPLLDTDASASWSTPVRRISTIERDR